MLKAVAVRATLPSSARRWRRREFNTVVLGRGKFITLESDEPRACRPAEGQGCHAGVRKAVTANGVKRNVKKSVKKGVGLREPRSGYALPRPSSRSSSHRSSRFS